VATEDKFLSPEKVAEILDVNPATVRAWLRDGTLKGHKIAGRVWRIKESDLKRFVEGETEDEVN